MWEQCRKIGTFTLYTNISNNNEINLTSSKKKNLTSSKFRTFVPQSITQESQKTTHKVGENVCKSHNLTKKIISRLYKELQLKNRKQPHAKDLN